MELKQYMNGISFSLVQPSVVPHFHIYNMLDFELANTLLPENDKQMKESLYWICTLPRMSTLALGAIINKAVSQMDERHAFVNVGVWNGFTFIAGMQNNPNKKCIGVDNFSEFGGPREAFDEAFSHHKNEHHLFYDMDYADYFTHKHNEPIGFYIFDGPHDYDNQLKGLQLAEPFFTKDCIIMVDDTNWESPRQATLDFIANSVHDYEILFDASTAYNGHPTFWNGVIVLQRK
ncbi:class I SAM-dependent methyltransferase [Paenibacillus sp. NPDC056579]|uniref:class I SAM-dependent methyltransferase n=1 Tax=Paenibacillus sp. NPDC056579 TaxID=3345871 RepID=UPI0036AFCA64